MTYTDKEKVEGSFNFKQSKSNNIHTSFYYSISEFSGDLEGKLDKGTLKTTKHNMQQLGCKAQIIKSSDASMLGHGCGVSQYPQFYDRI